MNEKMKSGTLYTNFEAYGGFVMRFVLTEAVNGAALKKALSEAVKRHPFMAWTVREENALFYYEENDMPMTVYHADMEHLPVLGGKETNFHLFSVSYNENEIYVSIWHGLTDGLGGTRFSETLLYYYFCTADEKEYEAEGVWKNDGTVYEGDTAEPYRAAFDVDPSYIAPKDEDSAFHLPEMDGELTPEDVFYEVRLPDNKFMAFVKENGISPSVGVALFMNHAICRLHPENRTAIKTAMPVDIRKAIGMPNTFKNATVDVAMYYDPAAMSKLSLSEQGQRMRKELKSKMDVENLKRLANASMGFLALGDKFDTYAERIGFYRNMPFPPADTYFLSYMGRLHTGEYGAKISSAHAHTIFRGAPVMNIFDCAGYFCIGMIVNERNDGFLDAFVDELNRHGLDATRSDGINYRLPYVAVRETLGLPAPEKQTTYLDMKRGMLKG